MLSGAVALADGRADNPGESWSRAILIRAGLPPDDLQTPIYDSEGQIGFVDFHWKGVVGEFDGKKKYKVPEGADADTAAQRAVWRRSDARTGCGLTTRSRAGVSGELHRPALLVARVQQAFVRARRRGLC